MASAILILDIEQKEIIEKFVKTTEQNFVLSPLITSNYVFLYEADKKLFLITAAKSWTFIDPLYVGTILSGLIYVMWGVNFWFWVGLAIASIQILKSNAFFSFMTKKGIKKAGYTGRIKIL
jgi:hypothetical protein